MDKLTLLIDSLIKIMQNLGIVGGFLLVLLESVFPVLPLALFIGINRLSYGIITGSIVSWFATCLGCMLSFLLFRTLLKEKFYKLFKRNLKLQSQVASLMDKMGNIDFNALVVLLAIPFTPAFAVNIAAGLSDISFKKYLIAVLISKVAVVYFWGFVGSNFLESIKNPNKLLEIVGIVFLTYLLSKFLEKLVKVEE